MFKIIVLSLLISASAVALVLAWNYWRFTASIASDIAQLNTMAAKPQDGTITEHMIAALPIPAQTYLRQAGVIGQNIPRIVHLHQTGRIRASADDNWMQLEADEIYSTNPPAFVWRAWFPSKAIPLVLGRDAYLGGDGSIVMKMLATLPVANDHGPELAPAGLMRHLNEMMWFPAAYLGPNVTITSINDTSFRVTIKDRDMAATAIIVIDAQGRPLNFIADRFNTSTHALEEWQTPMTAYRAFAGLSLPTIGSAMWKLKTGDFTYIELEITDVSYQY